MATSIRRILRLEMNALIARYNNVANRVLGNPAITDGTTDGKLQNAAIDYSIDGKTYSKAATDDLWDLSAQTDTIAAQYRAYALYLDAAGTATIGAGSNAASAALAIAALPAFVTTKCIVGVYVAGPSTDFNGAAGLAAQGTIHNGVPTGSTDTAGNPLSVDLITSIAP